MAFIERIECWLKHYDFEVNQTAQGPEVSRIYSHNCSGHCSEEDIKTLIDTITPRVVFPIHTNHPQRFQELGLDPAIEVVVPEYGHAYELETWLD